MCSLTFPPFGGSHPRIMYSYRSIHGLVRPCTYATRGANGCHFQGGEADCPAHAGCAAGHAAAGRAAGCAVQFTGSAHECSRSTSWGRSVMFCPRCWRVVGVHTVHSARRWCCIISIQISAPGIVYYTYFYLLFIIPYFVLCNPDLNWKYGPKARTDSVNIL